jgi:hypothetical protein
VRKSEIERRTEKTFCVSEEEKGFKRKKGRRKVRKFLPTRKKKKRKKAERGKRKKEMKRKVSGGKRGKGDISSFFSLTIPFSLSLPLPLPPLSLTLSLSFSFFLFLSLEGLEGRKNQGAMKGNLCPGAKDISPGNIG